AGDYSVEGLIPKKVQFRDKDESVNIDLLEDFDVLEGDIQKSIINDIPSIHFSDSIQQILIRDLDNNMILKLLGHNIGYSILQNKIYNLWKPSSSFCLMDIEHGYFLAKFKSIRFLGLPSYMYKRKILVEIGGMIIEYEFLPTICFHCGRYGHMKDVGPFRLFAPSSRKNLTSSELLSEGGNMTGDGT
ncbi:hypothetical protein Goarm_011709, partial [Gossypium armourianum]|nr:hypothetical protein [Gossypium armourianum]